MRALFITCITLFACATLEDTRAAPMATSPSSWTGFYAGLDVGLQSTQTDINTTNALFGGFPIDVAGAPTTYPANSAAPRFGGYLGYNWQFAPRWLTGLEADVGWAHNNTTLNGILLPGSFPLVSGSANTSFATGTNWDGSARVRAGYLVTPSSLIYVTGGVAWQTFQSTLSSSPCLTLFLGTCFGPPFSDTNDATRVGWTVGTGIETALWGRWMLRAQYRYSDFGSASFSNTNSINILTIGGVVPTPLVTAYSERLRTNTATLGLAYKFGDPVASGDVPVPIFVKAPPVAPATDWTGAYGGVDLGMRAAQSALTTDSFFFPTPLTFTDIAPSEPFNGTAARVGGYGGVNWQFSPTWVVGAEGDFGWADKTVTYDGIFTPGFFASGLAGEAISVQTTWDGSLRGRFGYLATPDVLLYATAGAAWQHFDASETCPATQCGSLVVLGNTSTRLGPTVGGGIELALPDNLRLRGEYRYANFGTTNYTSSTLTNGELIGTTYNVKMQTNTVLFGLAYLFNGR
jgi:outer membrane immunogenic protein